MATRSWSRLLFALIAIALGLALPGRAAAETFYFMTIFGSQCQPPNGSRIHTFATFVKATGTGDDWNQYALEVHTISWLPKMMDIKIWRLTPEEADNFGLHKTICWARENNAHIRKWGPYQIEGETFQRAVHRIGTLDADMLTYQAIDPLFRTKISNCIHAVSAIDPYDGRTRYPLIRVGFSASRHIAEVFLDHGLILNPDCPHLWLDHRLGLDCYPIETCPIKDHLLAAGITRPFTKCHETIFADIPVIVRPDFVVPPGCRHQ